MELGALRAHVRIRLGLLAAAAVLGAIAALARAVTPRTDVEGLADALGQAAAGVVEVRDVRWEPSRGWVQDTIFGRRSLFLASSVKGGPRDVYRALVRVTPEGRVLGVGGVHNLTQTPLGDDRSLVLRGARAAFATAAFDRIASVTLLDLSGEGAQNTTERATDRLMAWITNLQKTGAGAGVGRVDVTLEQPAAHVGLRLEEGALAVELAEDEAGSYKQARLDYARSEIAPATPGLHVQAGRHLPKRPIFWAVDTVRAVPWIGPRPIAWLEERAFAVKDTLKRVTYTATTKDEALAALPEPARVLDPRDAAMDTGHWPPPDIRSMWKTPKPGEGVWEAPKPPWLKQSPGVPGAERPPTAFMRTFVRPDEDRPYAEVLLVAMDMRQLDLDMEAGVEDPKPATGPPGSGRIPRDPRIYTRVAAAFNGGFKTEHGTYGMMVKRRVLLPPQPGAATVIVTRDQRVGLGTWGSGHDVGGVEDVDARDIVSFRQNLDPLVDNDKVNPTGRTQWGFTLPGTTMQTERSGLCVTTAGHLVYAWGDDVSATTLGKAMKMGGCIYGMHLDMNPHHTGLAFTAITEIKGKNYKAELLSTQMEISPDRYIEYAPKDFFYVLLHDPAPPPIDGVELAPDRGVQPAPAWAPGVWRARVQGIDLTWIDGGRAQFRLRAGKKEPGAANADTELDSDDAHRVVLAALLGVSPEKRPRGLATAGKVAHAMSGAPGWGLLVAEADGSLSIEVDARALPSRGDAAEVPILFARDDKEAPRKGAEVGPERPEIGAAARGSHATLALGTTRGDAVVLARGGRAEDLAAALAAAGCTRAVLLDRGSPAPPTIHRAGTDASPRAHYDETALYAMGSPLRPRGFRFVPTKPAPLPKR